MYVCVCIHEYMNVSHQIYIHTYTTHQMLTTLQHTWCLQHDTVQYVKGQLSLLQHVATHCNTPGVRNTIQWKRSKGRCRCCNTLQHTATHCNTLQHTATHCNALQHTATLQRTVTHCNTLQHTATHCNALQRTATHCKTLQRTVTHCDTLQHTVTHCNTMQHTAVHCNTCATH